MTGSLSSHLDIFDFEVFDYSTLIVKSSALKRNPLKDPWIRKNPVLIPKGNVPASGFPVVVILAGYVGNGPNYFSPKSFEQNAPQVIDNLCKKGLAPRAVYVFVDAMTKWGGSQFINSAGSGKYEDYIVKDLVGALKENVSVSKNPARWCVMGGSSGGYGALHLASKYPDIFGYCAAIAPDSFFEMSLLPDLLKLQMVLKKIGGLQGVEQELSEGRFFRRKEAFSVLNGIGMGMCYSANSRGRIEFPYNDRGELSSSVWKKWKVHDPVEFLPKRVKNLKKLKGLLVDVGDRDEHFLQFGCRQIKESLKKSGIRVSYSEFSGTHREIGQRRPLVYEWLTKKWGA